MKNISDSCYFDIQKDYTSKKMTDNLFRMVKNHIEENDETYQVTDEHEYSWYFGGLPTKPIEKVRKDEIYKIWVKLYSDSSRTVSWKVSVTTGEILLPITLDGWAKETTIEQEESLLQISNELITIHKMSKK